MLQTRTIYSFNECVVSRYCIVPFCVPAILPSDLTVGDSTKYSSLRSFEYRMLNIDVCSMFFWIEHIQSVVRRDSFPDTIHENVRRN